MQMMAEEQKTKLRLEIAHVLFIDIVGYSKLLIDEQSEALDELNQIVRNTEASREAEGAGQLIILPTGDGMALVFTRSVEEPVECALQISQALRAQPSLPVRMGIHSGPVHHVADVNQRENIAGAGINIAQRVMDCGDAGHILISKRVADDLAQYRRWQPYLHELGDIEAKHGMVVSVVNLHAEGAGNPESPAKFRAAQPAAVVEPAAPRKKPSLVTIGIFAAIFLLIVLGILALIFVPAIMRSFQKRSATATAAPNPSIATGSVISDKSIAVLPFENLSEDKANAYFADGIQDEILTRLSKIADLKVISRTSTQHYKSAPENLSEIGKELKVAHVVEGSVQKSGDAVRVNVQLIKAANDSHLWADTFDRKVTDVFSAETEIAKTIADQLRAKITGREEQVIAAKPTEVPEAYDAYLRGLSFFLRGGNIPANALPAQRYLRDAVRLDPKFALAWALLCRVDAGGYISGAMEKTPALREEVRQAAETALSLQPQLGEAVYGKGYYYYSCLKDYDTALRYFQQAQELLPNASQIPEALAYVARRRGEWDRSEAYFQQAEQRDPRNPSLLEQHALLHTARRKFAEADRYFAQALALEPDNNVLTMDRAFVAQCEGDLARARGFLAQIQIKPDNFVGVQTQVRQNILERDPAGAVTFIQQVLTHPDPTIPRGNAEYRVSLGWTQKLAGDEAGARQNYLQARSELETLLKEQPDNAWIMADLALTYMGLGDKAAAFRFAEQGIAANPVEKDAMLGPGQIETLARVAAQMGEPDRAISALEKLLQIPGGHWIPPAPLTPALLRLDPMFGPLRNDPRFQKLASSASSGSK
jgi:TolB-like protein/Tfp pilus assembly protein PilF/class 3 adenylate cyclase